MFTNFTLQFQQVFFFLKQVSLSIEAERNLEEKIQRETKGDVMYFWARLDVDNGVTGSNNELTFWSMCDILNGGHCRSVAYFTKKKNVITLLLI